MLDVWSAEYSALALPSRWRAAPAKKSMLSTLPGTSNSVEPHRLSRLANLFGDQLVGMLGGQLRQLEEHRGPVDGVAVAHVLSAARADATAVSTSPGDASAYSATASPVAGFMTRCRPPPVTTEAPSIQLPATVDTVWEETTVMGQR